MFENINYIFLNSNEELCMPHSEAHAPSCSASEPGYTPSTATLFSFGFGCRYVKEKYEYIQNLERKDESNFG